MRRGDWRLRLGLTASAIALAGFGINWMTGPTLVGSGGATRTYTLDADFDEGALSGVNHDAPNGNQLQLSESTSTEPFMYVAHTSDGILLKIDTTTGAQVARYHTTRNADCPMCPLSPSQWYPSRTAVDFNGDVWVANRAFNVQGSITKIANNVGDCIDRNNNGTIETSKDADNDGAVELIPGEFYGQADECIIKSIPVAGVNHLLRALAIDGDGDLWVGTFQNGHSAYEVDGVTHTVKRVIPLSSPAYGFVVRGNFLYHASLGNAVERIDISAGANLAGPPGRVVLGPIPNYGIAVDTNGIAWFGDYNSGVRRCDFTAATCAAIAGDSHYGVAVDGDGAVWAAAPFANRVQKYSPAGVLLGHTAIGSNLQPYGLAIGHDGEPWTAGFYGVAKLEKGPAGGAPGSATLYSTSYSPGQPPGVNSPYNYTYSDFTGFQARNVTVKQGTWTIVHDGTTPGTDWGRVTWNQQPEGSTPTGTSIKAEVRSADTVAGLGVLGFTEVSNGALFSSQTGRYLEVRMTLRITDVNSDISPVLSDVTIEPANAGPTATCADVTVGTGPSACSATASINNGSSDPDGDPLSFLQEPAAPYSLGTTLVSLTVSDTSGASASCSANVTVVDDAPPSIVCPPPTTIECTGPGTMFTPLPADASDNCTVAVNGPSGGAFPVGTTTLAYSAFDGTATASCTSAVTVADTTAPTVTSVSNSFASIWPPNHAMIPLNLTVTANDSCAGGAINGANSCRVTSITSNEAINSTGDGNTDPDWIIPANGLNASVRAERKGNGSGRVYTITVVCTDAAGNDSAPATTTVVVPHSQGKK